MAKQNSKKSKSKKKQVSSPTPTWIYAIGIFAFAFLLYANTISHGFVLDDDLVCNKNQHVQNGFAGLKDIFTHSWYHGFTGTTDRYYRPMMLAGFAVETSLLGTKASVYHFMNVVYYGLSCVFLFFVIRLFFKKQNLLVPLAATLLFTAHPLHTEVVANIKSRDEIFAFLGLLGVIYGILKYNREDKNGYFVLALASYFFAVLSKEAALAILGVVPLVLYFFTKTPLQKILIQTASFGVIAAIYFSIRMGIIDPDPTPFETIDNSLFAIDNFSGRLATAIGMLGEYFRLLIFPHPLSFDYSFNTFPELGWTNWKVLGSIIASSGLIYLTIKGLRSKNIISFSILFFALTFAITSNIFFLIGATFAERFLFVPLLGFCIAVSFLLQKYLVGEKPKSLNTFYSVLGAILLLYSAKTFTRNSAWKSDTTLFETGIHTAPNSSRTQSFYGVMLYRKSLAASDANLKKQYLDTSVEYLKKSINTYPGFTETYQHLAMTHEAQNQNQLAIQTYKDAIKTKPEYFPAMTNLGILYYKTKNYSQAESYLTQSLNFSPNNAVTNRALGLVFKDTNRFDLAATHFKLALDAQYNETHLFDLVNLYKAKGDIETAIIYDKKVKELRGEIVN